MGWWYPPVVAHDTRACCPRKLATISYPNASHKTVSPPARISFPFSCYQKNLYFAVRSRNPRPPYHSGSIRQRRTRNPRA